MSTSEYDDNDDDILNTTIDTVVSATDHHDLNDSLNTEMLTEDNANDDDVLNTTVGTSSATGYNDGINNISTSQNQLVLKQEPIFEVLTDRDANAVEDLLNESYEQCGDDDDLFIHKTDVIPAPV